MRRLGRLIVPLAVAGSALAFGPGSAWGAPALITVDNAKPELENAEGDEHKTSVGVTNLTDSSVDLTARPTAGPSANCKLELGTTSLPTTSLPAAQKSDVAVTIPAGCKVDDHFAFDLTAAGATGGPQTVPITAAPKPEPTPDWNQLLAFPIALLITAAFCAWIGLLWPWPYWWRHRHEKVKPKRRKTQRPLKPDDVAQLKFNGALPGLPATYDFKDSWVSNITAIVALFTGIFASTDVVKSFLGDDAESSLALASVGAAVALAFTGAGPIFLLSTRAVEEDAFTVGGLLGAAALTLAGALGGLWVAYQSGRHLDLDGLQHAPLIVALIVTALLLAVYAYRTLIATLEQGIKKTKAPPSDTILAANRIAKAIRGIGADPERLALRADLIDTEEPPETPDWAPAPIAPGPRRSALL